jgi:hypothetical protein
LYSLMIFSSFENWLSSSSSALPSSPFTSFR